MNVFNDGMGALLGVEDFAAHLRKSGRSAGVVDRDRLPWIPRRWLGPDQHLIAIDDGPVDAVSVKMAGWTGIRRSLKARTFELKIGRIPVASRQIRPLQIHFLVRGPCADAATLKQHTTGLLHRERTGLSWEGGALAAALDEDLVIVGALERQMQLDDGLWVQADEGFTRIVLQTAFVYGHNLLREQIWELTHQTVPPEFLAAVDRIAGHVRRLG